MNIINKLDKLEREEHHKSQMMYKDLLNKQIAIKNGRNLGTMTEVEK